MLSFQDYLRSQLSSGRELQAIDTETTEASKEVKEVQEVSESVSAQDPEQATEVTETRYVIYRDRPENFICEMKVEGAAMDNVEVKLMLESDEWNLYFNGRVDTNGKCTIPLKKLPILREGLEGRIRMEVIADDTRFVPWEDNFVVKASKRVSVVLERAVPTVPKGPSVKILKK